MQALVSVSEDLDEEAVDKLHLPVIRSDSETYVRSPIIGPPTRPELKDVLTLSRSAGCTRQRIPVSTAKIYDLTNSKPQEMAGVTSTDKLNVEMPFDALAESCDGEENSRTVFGSRKGTVSNDRA
jgi:hypothetical protein